MHREKKNYARKCKTINSKCILYMCKCLNEKCQNSIKNIYILHNKNNKI